MGTKKMENTITDSTSTSTDSNNTDHIVQFIHRDIHRMENALNSLRNREIKICKEFTNSEICKNLVIFPKTVRKQWLSMDNVEVTYLINKVNETSELNRQKVNYIDILLREGFKLTKDTDKQSKTMFNDLYDLQDFLRKLVDLKNEQSQLKGLIKSIYKDSDQNITKLLIEWMSELSDFKQK